MAQRVERESDYEKKGRKGLAEVVRLSETKIRVDFYPNDEVKPKLPAETFEVNVVYGEDGTVPEYLPIKKIKDRQKFQANVTMNEDGDKVLFAVPASGYFDAKFNKFITGDENAPAWETKEGRGKKPYRYADMLLELVGGTWQGLKISSDVWAGANYWYRIYDNLAEGEGGGLAVAGSGTGSDNLADFLDATVGGGEQIPFSENPLPEIQKIAQENEAVFALNVAKGWVSGIVVPLPLDDDEIGFLQDEEADEVHEALKD